VIDFFGYLAFFGTTALTYALIALGLNVQWGQTGLFNVGLAGFVAIGAYVSALLTTPPSATHMGGFDLPIAIGWAAAMAASALATPGGGARTLRLRSDYLAITTFGVAVAVQLACLNATALTGGPFGIGFIPRPFGTLADRPAVFAWASFALVAAVMAGVFVALQKLAASPWGRVLRAIRDDEAAVAALGKSPENFRLQAFALGGALMGLGGAVQAHAIGFIAPDNYLPALTFQVWTMLILGGAGNNAGAVLGTLVVWGLWSASGAAIGALVPAELQARAAALQLVVIGVALATMLVLRPRGLLGEKAVMSRAVGREAGPAAGPEAPPSGSRPPAAQP
jgi:branched-chain amino acid transport system permease protein